MSKSKSFNIPDQEKKGSDDSPDTSCVISRFQSCANLAVFTGIFGCVMLLMTTIPFYIPPQLTNLEKQFSLTSIKSGILISGNDIGYLVSILIITHFAKRLHIPRVLALVGIVYGILAMFLVVPNFIAPKHLPEYSTGSNDSEQLKYICKTNNGSGVHKAESKEGDSDGDKDWVISFFLTLLIIMGTVGSAKMSLTIMYIDNSVDNKSKTSYAIGVVVGMATFGPSFALLMGAAFASLPVNLKETFITQSDPRWIGAWWLGFIFLGLVLVIISVPLLFFPRRLPGAPKSDSNSGKGAIEEIKDLPMSVWRLLTNRIYLFAIFSRCITMFAVIGLVGFGPKYLQLQFNLPAYKANYLLGIASMVMSTFGTVIGGIVTGKLQLSRSGCAKMIIVSQILAVAFQSCNFIFGCKNSSIEGIDFFRESNVSSESPCFCDDSNFLLSCGEDGVTYSSPCRAGCWNITDNKFNGCHQSGGEVTPGICDDGCPYLIPYLVMSVLMAVGTTFAFIPNYMLVLRSVTDDDKGMAIALIEFLVQLLGYVPSDIVYGKVVDTSCRYYAPDGVCSLYDLVDLRMKIHGMEVGLKVVAILLVFVVLYLCNRAEKEEQTKEQASSSDESEIAHKDEFSKL